MNYLREKLQKDYNELCEIIRSYHTMMQINGTDFKRLAHYLESHMDRLNYLEEELFALPLEEAERGEDVEPIVEKVRQAG